METIAIDCIDCHGEGGYEVQIGCAIGWHRCTACMGDGRYWIATDIPGGWYIKEIEDDDKK